MGQAILVQVLILNLDRAGYFASAHIEFGRFRLHFPTLGPFVVDSGSLPLSGIQQNIGIATWFGGWFSVPKALRIYFRNVLFTNVFGLGPGPRWIRSGPRPGPAPGPASGMPGPASGNPGIIP